ncbi:MAG: GGDEF domain-containing protein [Bacteroidales bacterium]|nr:GGDEF domain-containing protein [Bacteroidales bacterium]MCM1422256.1 GGDEF domain-containing protein [bacterium]
MYHCHICFYLISEQRELFAVLQEMPRFLNFTHEYIQSDAPDPELAVEADVILADVSRMQAEETLSFLISHKKAEAELILLADKEQTEALTEAYDEEIADIWVMPLSESELRFRLSHWQRGNKLRKDLWKTENYLNATINCVPHLVWYKDKEGAHMKVNDAFCKAVNKTAEQIEGRGHYYIWDIDPDEYEKGEFVCMESEYEVMEKRETCIFDETLKIGDSMRELKTYKAPLFDLDGSVMGTVGVATDVTQEHLYQQMMIKNANTDFLTGLYNRRYLYEYIEKEQADYMCVFCIDLDYFKSINDIYGHQEGDRALVLTAKTLQEGISEGLIARTGGDEFLVVMFGARTPEEVEALRVKIKTQLNAEYHKEEHFQKISASVGAAYSKTGEEAFDLLVGEADAMMYREKESGR